jgi:uncharacterized Zn finger protein (UPF0148 family)
MGDLLLQGWCMTNEGCENCMMPLMRSKTGEKVCTQCAMRQQQPRPVNQQPQVPPEDTTMKPLEKESVTDKASRLIGRKLLQGFTMLDQTCQGCVGVPLVGDRKSGTASCVLCHKSVDWPQASGKLSSDNASTKASQKEVLMNKHMEDFEMDVEEKSMVPQKRALSSDSLTRPIESNHKEHLAIIKEKIDELMKEFRNTSHPTLLKQLAEAITSCSDAYMALDKIYNKESSL